MNLHFMVNPFTGQGNYIQILKKPMARIYHRILDLIIKVILIQIGSDNSFVFDLDLYLNH